VPPGNYPALAGRAPEASSLAIPAGSYLDGAMIVSLYGTQGVCFMGELGCHAPEVTAGVVQELARHYDALNGAASVIPALHLIVEIAQSTPQTDGSYVRRMSDERLAAWVEVARNYGLLLFLDLQIGWGRPVDGVEWLSRFLVEPFVHLALDPEFATAGDAAPPGIEIGSLDGKEINAVQQRLAEIVAAHQLPPKLLVVHQFRSDMLTRPELLAEVSEVELIIDMDGFGRRDVKLDGYRRWALADYAERAGIKLFLRYDAPTLISPADLLALDRPPAYVIYQ
jgi:hypothetical protein